MQRALLHLEELEERPITNASAPNLPSGAHVEGRQSRFNNQSYTTEPLDVDLLSWSPQVRLQHLFAPVPVQVSRRGGDLANLAGGMPKAAAQ